MFVGVIATQCFSLLRDRRARLVAVAAAFRAAIDPDAFSNWRGHDLHKALLRDFPAHKKAVVEFRRYLRGKDRLRLEQLGQTITAAVKKTRTFFVMYCIPADGPELLKQRLEKLRDVGRHT